VEIILPQGWTGLEVAGGVAQQPEESVSGNMRLRKRQHELADFHAYLNITTERGKLQKFARNIFGQHNRPRWINSN
jgi:hypothetical protein